MKKLIIVLILSVSSISLCAQQTNIPYYTQPGLHKFEGEWEYNDGKNIFKIILKMEKTYIKGSAPVYIDFLSGYHLYIKDQTVLQNSVGKDKTITSGGYIDRNNPNKIRFLFVDMGSHSRAGGNMERGTLELLSDTTAKWTVRPSEGVRATFPGMPEEDYNIYVPKYLILRKVK